MTMIVRLLSRHGESVIIPLVALLLSAALFGVFVLSLGLHPIKVFHSIYRGAFGTWFSWQNTLQRAAPLMLTALCTALPARVGLLFIGAEGALALGGLAAAVVGVSLQQISAATAIGLMAAAACLAGGLWSAAVGWLRHSRGLNETIASLLLNYIAIALLLHLVNGPLRDPESLNKPSTGAIRDEPMIGQLPGMDVHWGLILGVALCVIFFVALNHSTWGFAARAIGGNPRAARMAGLPVARFAVIVCFLAGACAGLAGMVEVAAVQGRANDSLIAGYGYTGILVAFLARHNPLLIIPVAILLGGIGASGGLLQRAHALPDATALVFQGIVFVVILLSESWYGRWPVFQVKEGNCA
jgi:ABC-type uncharacterized transport system permease subunit